MTATNGGELNADLLAEINKGTVISESSTGMVLGGSQGLDFLVGGTGLGDFDTNGFPHSGIITTFEVTRADRIGMAWNNMHVDAGKFWADIKAGDVTALGNLVFGGDDKFDVTGSINGAPRLVYNGFGGNDLFHVNLSLHGAAIETDGGKGNDTFNYDANFDAATDRIDGGKGIDTVNFTGGSAADFTFGADSMVNVEKIGLSNNANFTMTMNDANVAAGKSLEVSGTTLAARFVLNFDGHAETDGTYTILGGAANDTIITGAGDDAITGGKGNDLMTGGLGADTFSFKGRFNADTITDFQATGTGHDVIHFATNDFANFDAVAAHMVQADATTVVISFTATDTITLQHVTLGDLSASDFTFG